MHIIKPLLALVLIVAIVLLPGCSTEKPVNSEPVFAGASEVSEANPPDTPAVNTISSSLSVLSVAAQTAKGDGKVSYESADETLTDEQEQLLLDYMNLYYQSLADLSIQDPLGPIHRSCAESGCDSAECMAGHYRCPQCAEVGFVPYRLFL